MLTTPDHPLTDAMTAYDPPVGDRATAPETSLPHSAQTHHLTLDRCRLERALASLEAPDSVEAGPLRLSCARDAIVLSRAWGGMRLSATVVLNTARNNLPRSGLVFEASEPFGALGDDGRLTLGYPYAGSRRVEFTISPHAGYVTVTVGKTTREVPAAFVGSETSAVRQSDLRLRRVFARFAAVPATEISEHSIPRLIGVFDLPVLISAEATNRDDGTIVPLPRRELARLLTRLGDLTDRLPLPDSRNHCDTSEILCRFDNQPASPTTPQGHDYVSYLVLDMNPFAHFARVANNPMTAFDVEIMPHGSAPELPYTREEVSAPSAVCPVLRIQAGRYPHYVQIRVPRATAQWACDELGPEDRLVMGLAGDGRVDVLIARVSDDIRFVLAPTAADPIGPTPGSVTPDAGSADAA